MCLIQQKKNNSILKTILVITKTFFVFISNFFFANAFINQLFSLFFSIYKQHRK